MFDRNSWPSRVSNLIPSDPVGLGVPGGASRPRKSIDRSWIIPDPGADDPKRSKRDASTAANDFIVSPMSRRNRLNFCRDFLELFLPFP